MWENRITLDFVKHEAARKKIKEILDQQKLTDNDISELSIFTDGGYVGYKVILSNKSFFTIFDDGTIWEKKFI